MGANIRALAGQRQMSLNRLADFAAVNRPHLLRVVSGKADATVGWLVKVANALGVEIHVLLLPVEAEPAKAGSGSGKKAPFRKKSKAKKKKASTTT